MCWYTHCSDPTRYRLLVLPIFLSSFYSLVALPVGHSPPTNLEHTLVDPPPISFVPLSALILLFTTPTLYY